MNTAVSDIPAVPVRMLLLLLLTAALSGARPGVLLVATVLLSGVGAALHEGIRQAGQAVFALLRRVRWLLLAILILYGWFMPGTPLWPALGAFAPSREGLQEGLLRVAALGLIVIAVYLLLATTPRGRLVAGLLWFGRPLRRLGVGDARFAVRLVLALEAVAQVQELLHAANITTATTGDRWQRMGQTAAAVMQTMLLHADQAPYEIELPEARPVPAWQWSLPAALGALLWIAARW